MERQQFIDNELENFVKEFPEATDSELDEILVSASKTFDAQTKPQTVTPEPQPQAEPTGMTNEIRQTLAPEVEPDLSLFQRFAGGPVGDALAGIGNIARQSQTVSPEALAVAQQQTVIPSKEEVVATLINNAQQGAQAIRNVPTAVGGLAAMIPSFATDIARGGTDILAGGAEMLGADQLGRRIKEEGKLAADTAKQLAAESTANLRQFYEGKPTDVEGEMLAEELQPSKKQGALAKAMTTKFLWDAENMPPNAFKAKYPEALPIDTFNAKFEEVLRGQSLPQTVKSFFFDMPLESVKTIYGAIAGDPEVRQRFIERPAETIVETGVGLGIGIKGGKELYKATKDIAKKATVFEKPQTIDEAAASKMQSEREMTDFLRKNTEQRDAMRQEQAQQAEVMTGAPNRGMSAEELASTMREPAPQNMEATTEFLTRKPTVTFGEAERLRGEEVPTGGMTINRQARPTVTFGGEGERTGEAIPEGKSMTVQPTAPSNKLDQLFKREPQKVEPKTYRSNVSEDMTTEELYNEYERVKQEEKINDKKILGDKYNQWRRGDSDVKERIETELGLTEEQKNQLYSIGLPNTTKTSGELKEMFESAQQPNFASTPQELGMLVANSLIKSNNLKGKPFGEMTTAEQGHYLAVKNAFQIMQDKGWNPKEVINAAAQKIARDTGGAHNVPELLDNFIKREPSTPSPQPQQATEVAPKDITPQPAEPTAVKTPEIEVDEFEIPKAKEAWQKTRAEIKEEMKNAIRVERLQKKQINTDSKPTAKVYKLKASKDIQATKEYYQRILDVHHKERVKEALAEGKPVPPEVLAEYPDLQPRPKSGPGMFGGTTVQNMYEEIAPKIEKGIDIFKEKAKEKISQTSKKIKEYLKETYRESGDFKINTTDQKRRNNYAKMFDFLEAKSKKFEGSTEEKIFDLMTETEAAQNYNRAYPKESEKNLEISRELDKILKEKVEDNTDAINKISNIFGFIKKHDFLRSQSPFFTEWMNDILKSGSEYGAKDIDYHGMAKSYIKEKAYNELLLNALKADIELSSQIKNKSGLNVQPSFLNLMDNADAIANPYSALNWLSQNGKEIIERIKLKNERANSYSPKIGMFGAGTLQNAYEKVEPTLKKGADMLFKKGKQAYETVKRNADVTRDMGRVVDITEKEGKPVETEPPLRQGPRFIGGKPTQKGAFNPSAIIDAISSVVGGKKKERPFEVTIGDPALAKEFEKTFKATQAAETAKKQTAKAREQSTMSAYKQGLVDLFSPIIDRVPKGPEREKVMSIVHDIFYLGSPAEAFMRKTKDIVLDKVKHEDYASYMAAKAITTFREHIEKPDRIKLAEDFLKSIDPKTIKDYEKITNEWHEKAWKPILEELKASGLGDPLIINNIMGNENYAPFFPAKQLGLPHGIGENAPGAGIYKLKGGMGDYMDVLAAKMKKGIAMIAAAKINQGKLAAIDSMLQYDKNNIKEAMPEYKGFYKERDPLTGKMLEIPIVEFPEPQPGSGLALMEARRDGKKVGYYVPKEIARAFDMAMGEGDTLGATMRGFQKMTQGFRNVWIEYNPIWQVAVNAPRDIMASVIEMPKIGNKFKFMGNLAKVAPAAVGDYVPVLGKIVQAFTGYDRKAFEKDVTKALGESKLMSTREPQYLGETDTTVGEGLKRAYGLTEKHTGIAKALDTIQEFGKDIERMTKIAANLTLEGDKRFSDPEVKNIVRQIGSPAFGVRGGGDLFKTIKTATMFYNATKQSWVAAKYFLEKDPIGAIAFASVPMGLYAATIAAENGVFGDDMEKAYTLMKGYDKENKLNFPIGYKDNGEVEYISLPLPQFLKPVMRIMRTAAKENPKFLDSIIKGFSEELPMLNPVVGLVNRITSYGDEKPPAAELSGQEIMTQDQWDAGGSIKGSAFLKAFWNDYLLGSQIRLKVKPNERNETWEDKAIRFVFGKVYKTNFNEDLDTSATRQKQALQRLKTREAATAETPQEQQKIIQDMVKEGYTPQKNVFKNVKQRQFVENLRKTNAPAARQMEIYLSGKSKEEKIKAFQKLNDLLKKKKK